MVLCFSEGDVFGPGTGTESPRKPKAMHAGARAWRAANAPGDLHACAFGDGACREGPVLAGPQRNHESKFNPGFALGRLPLRSAAIGRSMEHHI